MLRGSSLESGYTGVGSAVVVVATGDCLVFCQISQCNSSLDIKNTYILLINKKSSFCVITVIQCEDTIVVSKVRSVLGEKKKRKYVDYPNILQFFTDMFANTIQTAIMNMNQATLANIPIPTSQVSNGFSTNVLHERVQIVKFYGDYFKRFEPSAE